MTDKHTPEPWADGMAGLRMARDYGQTFEIHQAGGPDLIAGVFGDVRGGEETARANARRIVACVNALSGISTEAIESGAVAELVIAARQYMAQIGQGYQAHGLPFDAPQQAADTRFRTALAAMGVKP